MTQPLFKFMTALAITLAVSFLSKAKAQGDHATQLKMICTGTQDPSLKLEMLVNQENTGAKVSNLMIVTSNTVHRSRLSGSSLEAFVFETHLTHLKGKLPGGQDLELVAHPSASSPREWVGTLKLHQIDASITCDLQGK